MLMSPADPIITVQGVVKDHQALRPLRVENFVLHRGDIVSFSGLDAQAAEVLVGLLTGALLPDTGVITLFGKATREVDDSEAWLAMLDGVGILTDRAVLIGRFTVEQNIAMPLTLEVDPVLPDVRSRVSQLASEVGLIDADLSTPVEEATSEVNARVRLARALALTPAVLLAEHSSATLQRGAVKAFGADLKRVARSRGLAVLAITEDEAFARALGGTMLSLDPATGRLRPRRSWNKLFG